MRDQLERLEGWLDAERTSRRNFLIRVGKSAFAVLAAAYGGFFGVSPALGYTVKCCNLAYQTQCPGYSCPSGCGCYTWTCCDSPSGCVYVCGECYTSHCSFFYANGLYCGPHGNCGFAPAT